MNASARTVLVARGIALWAAVQDLAPRDLRPEAGDYRRRWAEWEQANPTLVAFVKREQFALFDRVNAAF